MAIAFDGLKVPDVLPRMKCGGVPTFDHDSGYAYRCSDCYAVIGSISQPRECMILNQEESVSSQTTNKE